MPESIQTVQQQAECLYSQAQVEKSLDNLAQQITEFLSDKNPLVLSALIGGIVTTGMLLPRLNFPLELDYIHATRYRNQTSGSELDWVATPRVSLQNREILVIDDILDGGITLAEIVKYCLEKGASRVYTAVLLDKQCNREPSGLATADFVGLEVPDRYVFGYGMDYHGYMRNMPGIYAI